MKNPREWHDAYTKKHIHYIHEKRAAQRRRYVQLFPIDTWWGRFSDWAADSVYRFFYRYK